jgi:hypothetical protein
MAETGLARMAGALPGRSLAPRIAFAGIVAVLTSALAVSKVPASAVGAADARPPVVATRTPRVLLMGDSVMNQQGSHAAFELRQVGIDARDMGLWGSSLLTREQYDFGKTNTRGGWLRDAAQQISTFNPDVVAVYLNHNYFPPFPRDAAGTTIDGPRGLRTSAGQAMVRAQASTLITILRARGARVFFVAPIPAGTISNPDPDVWNPIWHGYQSVLTSMHIPVIDSAAPLRGSSGLRVESKPSCTGAAELIRPPGDIHLTRFGAGLAGTVLASYVAASVGHSLTGNGAPGDHTVALVPAPSGTGYWLVGCDGSVYHFGTAAHLPGARTAIAHHRGVAAAAATRDGNGLWLVATDGTIVSVGTASRMAFHVTPLAAITGASATADGKGIVATTATGAVVTAGSAHAYGGLTGRRLNGPILDVEPTRTGRGYWLVGGDGGIFSFGDARFFGSMGGAKLTGRIVAMAATPDNRGYWQVGADGGIFSFGDARFLGTARWVTPTYPYFLFTAVPGPAVDVVAAPGENQGYWVVGDTGRVTNAGAALGHAGDNGLALLTQ